MNGTRSATQKWIASGTAHRRAFRVLDAISFAFALLTLLICASSVRAENYLPKLGGHGGSQFDDVCPAGQNLTGFELRVGDDVDAIRPLCVIAYTPKAISEPAFTTGSGLIEVSVGLGGLLTAQQVAPGWHGGPGGIIQHVRCPLSTPIVLGMDIQSEGVDTQIVDTIALFCGLAATQQAPPAQYPSAIHEGSRYVPSSGWLGIGIDGDSARKNYLSERCPAGEVAVGLHGRTGIWVDAIGLICGAPRITVEPNTVRAVGRVKVDGSASPRSGPPLSICDKAKAARARNSPAAPGLEAQCQASQPTVRAVGRVKSDAPSGPPIPICDAAAAARDRNSPAAPGLAARCQALGGQVPPAVTDGPSPDDLAAQGEALAAENALYTALRNRQPEGEIRHGFDIGLGATGLQTAWGPGKQRILDSLPASEQEGFKVATTFAMDRNRNVDLADVGAFIADSDPAVAASRARESDPRFWLGFDIASGLFGDPGLGARGNTATGPGSDAIRNALSVPAQRGFRAAVAFHLSRKY